MERKSGPLHHRWDDCRGGRPEDQGGVCWLAANGVSPINAPPRRACPLIPPLFFLVFPSRPADRALDCATVASRRRPSLAPPLGRGRQPVVRGAG